MKTISQQLALIKKGAVEIIQENELKSKLERGKPLIIKAGFDPTVPDIHLGHTVLLRKLRHFQELGHKVVFLIGDATALVGDPSGQSKTRKTMTHDEVGKNAGTYVKQVSKILDTNNPKVFELRFNSDWFSKHGRREKSTPPFAFEQFVELAQRYTIARLLERDDFQKRFKENKPISYLELFYPLMQGYDSVHLKADIEVGGTDQKFNMLVGRNLQQAPDYDREPQVVITMPLLEGLDGAQKMSKSFGNYIGINESPIDIYGKLMSISDELMYKYYELLTDESVGSIKKDVASGKLHPKKAKSNLAKIIVAQYYNAAQAEEEEKNFDKKYKDKTFPSDISRLEISTERGKGMSVIDVILSDPGRLKVNSRSEAKQKIRDKAVEINGEKESNVNRMLRGGEEYQIRIGRKFSKIYLDPRL